MSESKVGRPSHDSRLAKLEGQVANLVAAVQTIRSDLANLHDFVNEDCDKIEMLGKELERLGSIYKFRFPGDFAKICPKCRKRVLSQATHCPNCEEEL